MNAVSFRPHCLFAWLYLIIFSATLSAREVTVIGGTGSGSYPRDDSVTITANSASGRRAMSNSQNSGMVFLRWWSFNQTTSEMGLYRETEPQQTFVPTGNHRVEMAAVSGKIQVICPPLAPDAPNQFSILSPKSAETPSKRYPLEIHVTLAGYDRADPADIFKYLKVGASWFPTPEIVGMWHTDEIASFWDASEGGTAIKKDGFVKNELFTAEGSKLVAKIWYQPLWTREQLKSAENPQGKEMLPNLSFKATLNTISMATDYKKEAQAVSVKLFPLEVKEVWSNQIVDVQVNGFPDKTGRNNQTYALMGVRSDDKAYIRLKLKSAIPSEARSKILFRLRQPQVLKPGSSSFGADGDKVEVIAENISDNPEINHRVYYGYDRDGNGELLENEVLESVSSTANGKDKIPVEFKIISKARHEQSRKKNIEFAGNGFGGAVPNMAPNGASLIKSFHKALPPVSDTTSEAYIDRTGDKRLAHPVGVLFKPTELPGKAVNGIYNLNHELTGHVLKSRPFRNALRKGFSRILPILTARKEKTGIVEDFLDFTWEDAVGDPSLNFRLNLQSNFSKSDFDTFLALGKVRVENARIGYKYDLSSQFVEVYFKGTLIDLYDFDYDDSFDLIVWSADEIRQGAETQAGYPTLTSGGKVFTTQVEIGGGGDGYYDTGYGFYIYGD